MAATRFQLFSPRKTSHEVVSRGTHLPATPGKPWAGPTTAPYIIPSAPDGRRLSAPCSAYLLARPVRSPPPPETTQEQTTPATSVYKIDSNARLEEEPLMHGRVNPAATSSDFSAEMNQSAHSSDPTSSPLSFHFEKPMPIPPPTQWQQQQQQQAPQPGTYVVQVPKDKVFRVPPPENARLFDHYTRRAKRRRRCSCCRVFFYLFVTVFSLAVLLAAFAAVMYLVLKPKQPEYTLESLAVSGLDGIGNASSPGSFLPEFDATIRADNPNGKIGVHYEGDGSHVAVSYGGMNLATGTWPAFYQQPLNVTSFVAKAKGAGIRFSERVRGQMAAAERLRSVPFDVDIKVPVRLQFSGVKTWAVPVRVRCAVAVDSLADDAKVVSRSCDVKVPLLF